MIHLDSLKQWQEKKLNNGIITEVLEKKSPEIIPQISVSALFLNILSNAAILDFHFMTSQKFYKAFYIYNNLNDDPRACIFCISVSYYG